MCYTISEDERKGRRTKNTFSPKPKPQGGDKMEIGPDNLATFRRKYKRQRFLADETKNEKELARLRTLEGSLSILLGEEKANGLLNKWIEEMEEE